MWIWTPHAFPMLDDRDLGLATLDFLQQQHVNTLYLYAARDSVVQRNVLLDEPDKYRWLVSQAHSRGMRVEALIGDNLAGTPGYILPENRAQGEQVFQDILDYNLASGPEQRFDGVNVDIEPYLPPVSDWETNTVTRAKQYLDLSARYLQMKRQYLNDIGQDDPSVFAVGPATPFWFDTIEDVPWSDESDAVTQPVSKPLYQHVVDVYDYITIMDYRDFALEHGQGPTLRRDGIVPNAQNELDYAASLGKPVVIGVETTLTEHDRVSFYQEGADVMEQQLAIARAEFERLWPDTFTGFAIHDITGYQRLIGQQIAVPEPFSAVILAGGCVWLRRRSRR